GEWRGVDPALEQEGVARAAERAAVHDPLVLQHHRLRTAGPEGVDIGLEVLLVDDEIVRLGAGHGGEGAGGRVGEGDAEGGPADLAEADGVAHLRGARGDVRAGALAAQLLDLVALGRIVRGEVLDLAAAVLEHADHVAALVADGAATGEACGGGEEDAAQHHDDGDTSPSARTVTRTTLASCCAV